MPRGPRLDAPGVLHHVMARGLERRPLFRDDRDRTDFLQRLATRAQAGAWTVYAWTLLPNHVHLLVRTGTAPLATTMRALLAGYAGAFNRRHRRTGHLFQNRYKSVVVEAEVYFLELVRYLHLNPLRAGVVPDLAALGRYRWCGHAVLLGRRAAPWQHTSEVLGRFAATRRVARERYRAFVAAGVPQGRRPELQGGGLRRSAGGWAGVAALRRGRERWAADERILGSGPFVEAIRQEVVPLQGPRARAAARAALPALAARCAAAWGITPAELTGGGRRRVVAHARAVASGLAVRELGLPIAEVARALGVSPTAVRLGVARAETLLKAHGLAAGRLLKGKPE
jgi:REP element-mobilizing transposase RayT